MNDMTTTQNKAKVKNDTKQRLEAMYWALVFIWAGIIFAADSANILPSVGEADAWSWVFFGAGAFSLVGNVIRMMTLTLPNPNTWDYAWSTFLLAIGLGGILNTDVFGPVFLLVIGVAVLAKTLSDSD
jgi:hypothetical protein